MSDNDIASAVAQDLAEDAYATQERDRIPFTGKQLARGMETTLFICPKCSKIGTLHTDDNAIFCDCGFRSVYDVYGGLTDSDGTERTITAWDLWQQKTLAQAVTECGLNPLFSDHVTIHHIKDHTITSTQQAQLTAYRDHITVNDIVIPRGDITSATVISRNILTVYCGEKQYEIRGSISFCALKYLYLYNLTKED